MVLRNINISTQQCLKKLRNYAKKKNYTQSNREEKNNIKVGFIDIKFS